LTCVMTHVSECATYCAAHGPSLLRTQNQEKRIIADIKKMAKEGQNVSGSETLLACKPASWRDYSRQLSQMEHMHSLHSCNQLKAGPAGIQRAPTQQDLPTCCGSRPPTCHTPLPRVQDAVRVMAKSLVRNRHAVTKMYGLKSQLQAVSLRVAVSCL
jgi:hypothetical protein